MAKKVETRLYSMSDADLKQTADDVAALVTRDITDFTTRNVTAPGVTDLQGMTADFEDMETDEELLGIVNEATLAKDTYADDIRKRIRVIRNMADLQYNGVGKYGSFGFADMANMSDNELYRLAKRVVRVATKLAGELGLQGLTPTDISGLSTAAGLFDNAIDAQHAAMETRDLATEERITLGNSLWTELVRLCSIGKSLYQDTDEAKYNDYVLTESSSAAAIPANAAASPNS